MMKDFPAQEQAVFLINDLVARLVLMKQDEMNDKLPDDIKDILKQHGPLYAVENDLLPADYIKQIEDIDVAVDILRDHLSDVVYMSSFEGSVETFQPEDISEPLELSYDDDIIAYIPSKKDASLFTQAYKNIDELEQEYRKALKDWLPDNFLFRRHIVNINGTYCC